MGRFQLLVVLACIGSLARTVSTQNTSSSEAAVLLELRAAFTNWDLIAKSSSDLVGWNKTSDPCAADGTANWGGLTCSGGSVTRLSLYGYGLIAAQLPASLATLQALTHLDLSANSIAGTLPTQWAAADALPVLDTLSLQNNRINGSLPLEWGTADAFQKLQYLQLQKNRLSGSLPDGWGSQFAFPDLATLDVSNNNLTGSLPAIWGTTPSLPSLGLLTLDSNFLTGTIPSTWTGATGLQSLSELDIKPGNPGLCGPLPKNTQLYVYSVPAEANSPTSYFTSAINCTTTSTPTATCSTSASGPANTDQPTQLMVAVNMIGSQGPVTLSSSAQATLMTIMQNLTGTANVTLAVQPTLTQSRRLLQSPSGAAAPSPATAAADGTVVVFTFSGSRLSKVLASVVDAMVSTTNLQDAVTAAKLPVTNVRLVTVSTSYAPLVVAQAGSSTSG